MVLFSYSSDPPFDYLIFKLSLVAYVYRWSRFDLVSESTRLSRRYFYTLYWKKKQEIIQLTIAQWTHSTISKSLSSAVLRIPLLMMNKNVYSFDDTAAPHTITRIPSLPVHGFWPRKAVFCSLENLIVQCQYIPGPKFSVSRFTMLFLYGWSPHRCTMIVDFLPLICEILIIWRIWMNEWMGFYITAI